MLLWARDLLPSNEITASRGSHAVSHGEDRVAVAESLAVAWTPMARRRSLQDPAPVGGLFGLATLFPLASLGPRPGNASTTRTGYRGQGRNRGRPTPAPGDLPVDGILTVFPEGHIDDARRPPC